MSQGFKMSGSQIEVKPKKREKTIRSETTKVFLVIFAILATVGLFTIVSTFNGAKTFNAIKGIYLQQFQAAEIMKQKSLDIIGIFYLLAGDQDMEIQMEQMQRYDALVNEFEASRVDFEKLVQQGDEGTEKSRMLGMITETKKIFDVLNTSCREMTIGMMEGRKEDGKKAFAALNKDIAGFKAIIDGLEKIVKTELTREANRAQGLLENTSYAGIAITLLAIFVTIGLIYYLMQFLSVSLLPISNLMHNMRQAVFSIDKSFNVISPISNYSTKVFGDEIVGRSIFDVVYKDLDPKSEVSAGAKSALISVFGEDDMQWMLAEDSLPVQIRHSLDGGADKILKMSYTPLWNKLKQVENIMLVAEDVTEMEELRAEATKKQGEVIIIQGLVSADRTDLEVFLTDTQKMLKECESLVMQLDKSLEMRQLLFRHLHTIKGNSRLYNLNLISEVVHTTEAIVVEINACFSAKVAVPNELYEKLTEGLNRTDDIFAVHCRMAQKLFGIKNMAAGRKADILQHGMAAIEIAFSRTTEISVNAVPQGAIAKRLQWMGIYSAGLDRATDLAHEAALYFDSAGLAAALTQFKIAAYSSDKKVKIQEFGKLCDEYCLNSADLIKPYDFDSSKWVSVLQKIFDVNQAGIALNNFDVGHNDLYRTEEALSALYSVADAEGLIAIRTISAKMLLELHLGTEEEKISSLKQNLSGLWSYTAIIFSLESSFAINQTVRTKLANVLKNLPADVAGALLALESVTGAKVLLLSYLRSMARCGIHPNTLIKAISTHCQLDEPAVIEIILGDIQNREGFSLLAKAWSGNSRNESQVQVDLASCLVNIGPVSLRNILESVIHTAILRTDLVAAVSAFVRTGYGATRENTQQMVEISSQVFNKIRTTVERLGGEKGMVAQQTLVDLNCMIAHAFDYPLIAMCKKMEPMVKDLSKRLGKDISYKITGEDVSVERETAYALRDALVHLIRNSLDHGIETPEERVAAGKSALATLTIACRNVGANVEVIVRDDGRGINVDRVVKKAVDMGKIKSSEATELSNIDKLALIFIPQLTTREEVTSLSGRGVGMDAVKTCVEKLGGTIRIDSTIGNNTEIRIEIPSPRIRTGGSVSSGWNSMTAS
jgi:signal transduction histidine kinase